MPHIPYRARRRLALLVLLVFLPAYIIVAGAFFALPPRLPLLVELAAYAFLGVAWAWPFKFVFRGVAARKPD